MESQEHTGNANKRQLLLVLPEGTHKYMVFTMRRKTSYVKSGSRGISETELSTYTSRGYVSDSHLVAQIFGKGHDVTKADIQHGWEGVMQKSMECRSTKYTKDWMQREKVR